MKTNWRKLVCAAALGYLLTVGPGRALAAPDIVNCDGYPNCNFSFGVNVSQAGDLFTRLVVNPAQLGQHLRPMGKGQFTLQVGDTALLGSQCATRRVERGWPFCRLHLADPRLGGLEADIRTLVPITLDDAVVGSLPVAMAEITLFNPTAAEQGCTLAYTTEQFLGDEPVSLVTDAFSGAAGNDNLVAWSRADEVAVRDKGACARLTVPADGQRTVHLLVAHYGDNYASSAYFSNLGELGGYVARNWDRLVEMTGGLDEALPRTWDDELNSYLRWYMTCSAMMTKCLKDGTVINMGYTELNQRDSFWTSWAHLVLWPSLERKMIEESIVYQREDGKIPTCILPVIERNDDIDINCYFVLRSIRYCRYHRDDDFARRIMPGVLKSLDWLYSRDQEDAGLPQQASFWGDWKDVGGVEGRKYSPYAGMLYIAANQYTADYCERLGMTARAAQLRRRAERGLALLNRPVEDGGLWNGEYYQQVWREPAGPNPRVLQDQVVGILFNVVTGPKAASILRALDRSMVPWGVRETWPYNPPEFGYEPGDYHNGGVWPWLCHVHAWALIKTGRQADGIDLLKRVSHADLVAEGDYIAHEVLHGDTGKNIRNPMQGWNASIFGTVYFGLLHQVGF